MSKVRLKPRRIACLTDEQQTYYESLAVRQRKYVDFRAQGYSKSQSYRMAGYEGNNIGQAAHNLEANNKGIAELIQTMLAVKQAKDIVENNEESAINRKIDALALQDGAEKALEVVEGADGETARRIQFYRDIASGKIKTVRKTVQKNAEGAVLKTTIEEISDIDTRIKARKELDKILGLNSIVDLDKLRVGDITINIVDASKKEELEDSRNKVFLDPDSVEIIDGEQVVEVQDVEEKPPSNEESGKDKFFETVGEQ
ncbi:MAG: hypothetical protein IJF83_01385 [Methanobrevibacter sp.]|nr:hypothetical protein [Methanobrevibacter sp.]